MKELRPTREATLIEQQSVLADLLTELRSRGQRFDTMQDFQKVAVRDKVRLHYWRGDLQWDTDPDFSTYFSDLNGRPFRTDELYFATRTGAALPDIVCRCSDRLRLRTRFHESHNDIEHENLVEPIRRTGD